MKPVARTGEVQPSVGEKLFTGADSGTWTAGTVTAEAAGSPPSSPLRVGGEVIRSASCALSFTGTAGSTTVTGTSTVSLTATGTVLTVGGAAVLRDGDTAKDDFDNTLTASSEAPLRSA